jgi:hypothetical protein
MDLWDRGGGLARVAALQLPALIRSPIAELLD